MTKTKKQLRAEAVERLKMLDEYGGGSFEYAILGSDKIAWRYMDKRDALIDLLTDDDSTISEIESTTERGMTNLEWLYEHDEYLNSFAKLMACLRGFSTDEFTANEWLRQEHSEPNPDCSAMLYKTFTGNMCSHYEPKDGVVAILREAARNLSDYHDAGEALRRLTDTLNVYHALETLADMIERDYVRRESIEEVMDNDRALVEENAKLASELEAAKLQIGQSDAPKSGETSENHAPKREIRDFDDSREQLEAVVRSYFPRREECAETVIGWLDRQAEITFKEAEANCKECFTETCKRERKLGEAIDGLTEQVDELKAERDKLRSQICKLEDDLVRTSDERDNWKANCEDWNKHARAAENACYETMLEREDYRKKFGKCLDYADAIHALMDEGMS